MRLGIIETGAPPPSLARFGDYPAMFRRLLGEDAYDYVTFDAVAGALPARVADCPAYLITGSPAAAYDDAPWIAWLTRFLQSARRGAALVGVCFGHQIMAQAFGGRVEKAAAGWGIGTHTYTIARPQPWTGADATLSLPASHQDQVVAAPPGAETVAGSVFCPHGVLAWRDQPAMSLQLHPEFAPDYAAALVESKRGHGPSDAAIDAALATARGADDRAVAARWIADFLSSATR